MQNMSRATDTIDQNQVDDYWKNGAICIRNLLNNDEINCLQEGIELNLKKLSSRFKVASPGSDKGLFVEDFCTWQENPFYKKFIFESPLAKVAALLMKSKSARLYHEHMLVKEPYTLQKTPWHQDLPYYNVDGIQNLSFWIPVDPVGRSSTLEFVASSHLGPWYIPRSFMQEEAKWFPEGSLKETPNIEANRDLYPILGWEVNPGDVVCFHMLTLHAAGGVCGPLRRRVFSVRFLGDDMRFAPRNWPTSPEFPGLNRELKPNAELDHPLFPIVYSL